VRDAGGGLRQYGQFHGLAQYRAQIIWDTNPTGDGSTYRGRIYAPDRDATYNSRLTLSGNTLRSAGGFWGSSAAAATGRA
jgi:uncharacterized protein (DUF2147 family)